MSRRALRMVGLVVCLLAGLELVQAVLFMDPYPAWHRALSAAGSVAVAGSWFAWRRSGARWLLLAFFIASFAATGGDGSGLGVLTVVLGVGLLTWGYGAAVGIGVVALAALVMELAKVVARGALSGRRWPTASAASSSWHSGYRSVS